MYYPFFYGKQFELLAIREFSTLVSPKRIFPIIEPVKNNFKSLEAACVALQENAFQFIVIVNPTCGELIDSSEHIDAFLNKTKCFNGFCHKGFLVTQDTTVEQIQSITRNWGEGYYLIHDALNNKFSEICDFISNNNNKIAGHVFYKNNIPDIKIRSIKKIDTQKAFVCLQDGFIKRKNADYPLEEFFSDQHILYNDQFTGFSDYLIVGREYSETGGPAYAIAIHLTFLDKNDDDIMKIFHFKSDSSATYRNPAGKFSEALNKMFSVIDNPQEDRIFNSSAIQDYRRLKNTIRYPGLGALKKNVYDSSHTDS